MLVDGVPLGRGRGDLEVCCPPLLAPTDRVFVPTQFLAQAWITEASKKAMDVRARPKALNPKQKVQVRLEEKQVLSHDTRLFRFSLPTKEHVLGLPVGGHFFVSAKIGGETVMRAYTPTSGDDEVGFFDLVVKVYFRGVHPKFPDGGKMSQHLESLGLGDTIDIKGPIGHFTYFGNGRIQIHKDERIVKQLGFICGGTGITPAYQVRTRLGLESNELESTAALGGSPLILHCHPRLGDDVTHRGRGLQVMKKALRDPKDPTKFFLVYANQTPADILLRHDLDTWAKEFPDRVKIWYTVDRYGKHPASPITLYPPRFAHHAL